MKKNLLSVIIILTSYFIAHGQAYDWGLGIGGSGYDNATKILSDSAGNVFVAGYFEGTINVNPHLFFTRKLSSKGKKDFFLIKYSPKKTLLWAFSQGSSEDDVITDMDIDSDGNIYITGYFHESIDIDPSSEEQILTSGGDSDIFWAKFTNDGSLEWSRQLHGTGYDKSANITVNDEYIYISGIFSSTIDFNPTFFLDEKTATGTDIFISQYSINNIYRWTRTLESNSYDILTDLESDDSNNIYATGHFIGTLDFDPGSGESNLSTAGAYDGFILKLTEAGEYGWAKRFGGEHNDFAEDILIDGGYIYASGSFQGSFAIGYFKNGIPVFVNCESNGGQDGILFRYGTDGSFKSRYIAGGTENESFNNIEKDKEGNFYLSGKYGSTATDFDFSTSEEFQMNNVSSASQGAFVASYTSDLNIRWVKGFGSTFDDNTQTLSVIDNNQFYLSVFSHGDLDMNPDADTVEYINRGNLDAILIKIRPYLTSADIESFSVLETSTIDIDSANTEVKMYVNDEIDLSNISAEYTLSEGAKLRESLGNNFSDTVLVTVAAEDTSITKDWTIVAFHNSDSLAELTSFLIDGYSCNSEIDSINKIITVTMMEACDISSLTPTIEFSQSASILPENGIAQNFSDTVTYTLESKDKSCTNTWNVVVKEFTTSIADNSPADFINVYPNPASDRVSIECSKGNTTYSLLSLTGQVVMSGLLAQGKNTIDLGHIKKGLYFFRLNTAEHDKVIKLIIE